LVAGSAAAQQTAADVVKQQCASAKTVVEFWHGLTSAAQQNVLNDLAANFNKTQKGACVIPVPQGNYSDLATKIRAGIAAGKTPTVAMGFENEMAQYLEANKLVPLKSIGVSTNYLAPRFLQANTFEGTLYGIPFNKSVQVMYFNKDLLKKHNAAVPTTVDEFLATARDLSKKVGKPVFWFQPTTSTFATLFFTLGGKYDHNGKIIVNSPEAVRTLQLFLDLVNEGVAKPITSGFINSQLDDTYGFSFDTSAGAPFYKSGAKFNVGLTTLPGAKRGVPGVGIFQGTNLFVFKDASKEQQAVAAKFINYTTQPRTSALLATFLSVAPASTIVDQQDAYKKALETNPDYGQIVKQARFATYEPRIPQWSNIRSAIIENAIKEAVAGKMTAKAALDRAQQQVEDVISGKTK
ncbi:MAG TPA: ABC transporter substrate-binding protein, partial [Deinococcales bacterium]|nr:ABC transporter substrate-binding protein [Deinococcales bacterium]